MDAPERDLLVPKAVSQSLCWNTLSEDFVEIGHCQRNFDKGFRQRSTTKLGVSLLGQALNRACPNNERPEKLCRKLRRKLFRKWPETARFDKVFDKGSRQCGLNRWFWDKL